MSGSPSPPALETYDVVADGGRVTDPGSRLDAATNVGVRGGRIADEAGAARTQSAGRAAETWSGIVVAQQSLQPIPGARISTDGSEARRAQAARQDEEPIRTASIADAEGHFQIEAERGARLRLSAAGFSPGFVELTPARENNLGTLVLRLERSVSLSGCLRHESAPAAGALVLVLGFSGRDEDGTSAPPEAVSDENGCFSLDGIRPDRGLRLVIVTGRIAQYLDLGGGLRARPYELGDVRIAPERRLTGRIVDARGMPVPGATIWPSPDDSPMLTPELAGPGNGEVVPPVGTISDSEGRFELAAFPGSYTLFVFKNGLAPARNRIHVADGEASNQLADVVLQDGMALRGRVIDSAGAPLAAARVTFQSMYDRTWRYWDLSRSILPDPPVVSTDVSGCFSLPGMLPGMRPLLGSELEGYVGTTVLLNEPLEALAVDTTVLCGGVATEIEMHRAGRIRGSVVDQRGLPVAGVTVSFSRVESVPNGARSGPPRPVTESDGAFLIPDLVPGEYELGIRAYGYLLEQVRGIAVASGETTAVNPVMTRIEERAPLEVRVVDHRGAPVPGARVTASIQSGDLRFRTPSPAAVAGADGRVWFPDAPLATYEIHADADGVRSPAAWRDVSALAAGAAPVVVPLLPAFEPRAFAVSGRLLDAEGEGVSAALLELITDEYERLESISETRGTFRFDSVPSGRYLLRAKRRGLPEVFHEEFLDVASSAIDDVVVEIPVAGAIHGRITGLPESAARGLRIDATSTGLRPAGAPGSISASGWADANGGFRVTNLAPGHWRLRTESSGGRSAEAVVMIERPGQDAQAVLAFPPAFTLTGRVQWRGRPLESALVMVGDGSAFTDDRGTFTIPELLPGRYGLSVHLRGTVFEIGQTIDVEADASVAVDIRGGSVAGRLLDADSGAPIAGAVIYTEALGSQGRYNWIDRTDPSGRFRLRPLAAGRWQLSITAPGYARRQPVIEVGNEDIDDYHLELRPSAGLRLRFPDSRSTTGGDLWLMWQDLSTDDDVVWTVMRNSWLRADGAFVWEEVPLGRGVLTVGGDGFGLAARFTVINEGEPVDVGLRTAGRLHLTVAALAADPALPATLRLYDDQGVAVASYGETRFERIQHGDRAGQFVIGGLAPGSLRAEVTADDGSVWSRRIEILAGEPTSVVLR